MDYTVTIEVLLQILQAQQHTGVVTALVEEVEGFDTAHLVRLLCKDGKLLARELVSQNGRILLSGEEVTRRLRGIELFWQVSSPAVTARLAPEPPPPQSQETQLLIGPLATPANAIPVRVRDIQKEEFRTLPRRYQQVYALVNNMYTLQKIADMLHLDIDTVFSLVLDLQRENILRLE